MRAGRWFWLAAASYVALAVLVVGITPLLHRDLVVGDGVDLPGTLWIHWWVRETLARFELPVHTPLFFYPDGKNFLDDTGANYVDALLDAPFGWLLGADGLDVLQLVILVGNALAMQRLALDLTGGRHAPAWAAAVAFELCPFALVEVGEGRPTQALLWFGILATRYVLRLGTGTWRDAALFGVLTALQGLTYWYTLYFAAMAWAPLVAIRLWRSPRRGSLHLALAVGIVVVSALPFVLPVALHIAAGQVTRLDYGSWERGPAADPTRWSRLADQLGTAPWLVALALMAVRVRRTWPWLVGFALLLVFAVGARVGAWDPPLVNRAYLAVMAHVPFLPRLGFPERAMALGFVLLCMGVATDLAARPTWCAVAFVALLVGDAGIAGRVPVRSAVVESPAGYARVAREGGAVIYLPFGASERAMLGQMRHGQPLFGGMGEREPDMRPAGYTARLRNTFVIMLGATLDDTRPVIGYTRADREAIASQFRWVWLDLAVSSSHLASLGYVPTAKMRRLVRELGPPVERDPKWAIWDLRRPIPADAPGLDPTARLASDELVDLGFGAADAPRFTGSTVERRTE